jgi:3-oxoacyl-[acyl-carrier protein] reductase
MEDRVALVTGGSRGIGRAVVEALLRRGHRVWFTGRDRASLEAAERELSERYPPPLAAGRVNDVRDFAAVEALVAEIVERDGRLDVLVNNAGLGQFAPVDEMDPESFREVIETNLSGCFYFLRAVAPVMKRQGEGRIVNISTIATDTPPPDQTKYVVAKSALVGLTRSLAIEFASRNILVNLVAPNFVETDFVAHVQDGFRKKIAREIPMQRPASPVDVARAVVVLASAYSSFTTGQKVMVTGGSAPFL